MKERYFFTSITRISNLEECGFTIEKIPRSSWETGDYVAGEIITCPGCMRNIELPNGRMVEVADGDLVIGAFGLRAATLEAVGNWTAIAEDNRFDLMTSAGLFGKITSKSIFLQPFMSLDYQGHVLSNGKKTRLSDFVSHHEHLPLKIPVILIIGTSMSAGKTTSGKTIVRQLKQAGYKVIAAKLTGAARYRDVLNMGDAGADYIFDFVDAGLPSTVCEPEIYRNKLRNLLSRIAKIDADVLVAEAGASPLEPYNGSIAMEELEQQVRCTVLCASDPYAVVGVSSAFNRKPDIVAGGATNTSAGIALVEKLTGIKGLNLLEKESIPELNRVLGECLEFKMN